MKATSTPPSGTSSAPISSASHGWMLRVGWRRQDGREIRGQLLRIAGALLISRIWVPLGNTGGANVSPLQPMPLPDDLRRLLEEMPPS